MVLSLSAARALRNAQGRGPFNSDATNVATHKYVIVEEPTAEAFGSGRGASGSRCASAERATDGARGFLVRAAGCGPVLDIGQTLRAIAFRHSLLPDEIVSLVFQNQRMQKFWIVTSATRKAIIAKDV